MAERVAMPVWSRPVVLCKAFVVASFFTLDPLAAAAMEDGAEPPDIGPEFVIFEDIAAANSNFTRPGRAGIAFDGQNYLVVTCEEQPNFIQESMVGALVSPASIVLDRFPIATTGSFRGCETFPNPVAAFDGTNYLVVFKSSSGLVGVRVTPDGDVLDPVNGFPIASTTGSADIAFNGELFLVVFNRFVSNQEIFAVRVTPAGLVLDTPPIPIFVGPGEQVSPTVASDGNGFLVTWRDTPTGSGPAPTTDITGARVDSGGFVLDPGGIPVSTAPDVQSGPHVTFADGNYFVAWLDRRDGSSLDIFGTRVTPDGELLDGPSDTGGIPINTDVAQKSGVRVGFDGSNYFVVWNTTGFSPPASIFGARVSPDGVVIDGPPGSPQGVLISSPDCFVCRLATPNISSDGQTSLITWLLNEELSGQRKDIEGAILVSDISSGNQPPIADAGIDETVQCTSPDGALVTLDGSGSADPDEDALTYSWSNSFGEASGVSPTVTLPFGSNEITLVVNDGQIDSAPDTVNITVVDETPPALVASLTQVGEGDEDGDDDEGRFQINFSASDACDPEPMVTAVLDVPGIADIAVVDGQIIEFEFEDDGTEVEFEDGILEIEASGLVLEVAAIDASGNESVAEVPLTGLSDDNDDDSVASANVDD